MTTQSPVADDLGRQLQHILAGPPQPADAYLALGRELYRALRFAEAERLAARAVELHPQARDLWNLRGVALRMLRRPADALAALDRTVALDPDFTGGLINRGNVLLDLGQAEAALDGFTRLLALDPQGPMPRMLLGRALSKLGRSEAAIARLREAVAIKPDYVEAWLSLAEMLNHLQRPAEAEAAFDAGLAVSPDDPKLLEGKALVLRLSGQRQKAERFLGELAGRMPDMAWVQFHLGDLLATADPDRAIVHLRRALELQPHRPDHMVVLLQALSRSTTGDEGAKLDEAYDLARRVAAPGSLNPAQTVLLRDVFARLCAFDDLAALGSFRDVGRSWAETGLEGALMCHIAQAATPDDRLELVEQHRIWGRAAEARAQRAPIVAPPPRPPGGKIRLGFMSSDLRNHPVGYFALTLFEHLDRDRFEVFVYSFYRGEADTLQDRVAGRVDGFRWWPEISTHDAAQKIADDQLDMLIELGGLTYLNRLDVMAYRLAPIQASWLGYPHSAGLSTIDHLICDAHNRPTDPALLIETPLVMPRSWIAMSPILTARAPPAAQTLPERRKGHITYGTANNTYKYTRATLAAWARATAATPGAHFAFIRPEGGSAVFRRNVEAAFAAEGVTPDRLDWHVIRGAHMAYYDEIDISLDTFPLTGGTTTVEALLMGVPVVSLVGAAFYERLSRSILITAGLGDLCAETPEAFQAIALGLAADPNRRLDLRRTLRADLEAGPLGQTGAFAQAFYDMVEQRVRNGPRTGG